MQMAGEAGGVWIICECRVKVVSQQLKAQVKWVSIHGFRQHVQCMVLVLPGWMILGSVSKIE